jgi:multisubunit Na+/H+ antiporter MnhB subunit
LFSAYPDGRPGVALLALRTTLGMTLVLQAMYYLGVPSGSPDLPRGLMALACGAMLTIGLFTPGAAVLSAGGAACLRWFPAHPGLPNLFDTRLSTVLGAAILVAVFLLGPGAFSVDARMFGRREIIIPPARPQRQ